jgi:hypothetical protein
MQSNSLITMAAVAALTLFAACGNNDNAGNTDSTAMQHKHDHEHTYACPMHPEVTGHEGETCPKCGMKLEHNDAAGNTNTYFMKFVGSPAAPKAGEEITLAFTPLIKGKEAEAVPLDVLHEKKIHLIIVSKDLSYFDHIHPEYQADGSYTVQTKFPAGGEYTLFADYAPTGATHQLEKVTVNVAGTTPAAVALGGQRLTSMADGYKVEITNESPFVTNNQLHMGAIISKDGKEIPADQLENYLGAKAHVVIIGLDDKAYMHVHPEVTNGKFDLHTTFEKPGMYKGWIQFQTNGQVHTADFILDVKEGKAGEVQGHGHDDGHDHSGHDHQH